MNQLGGRSEIARFAGKAIIITGGGRGIGKGCARLLGILGAKILLTDIDSDVLETSASGLRKDGVAAYAVTADVNDDSQANAIVDACLERFGRVDGLVNNAAIQSREWFTDTHPSWNRKMVEVNVLRVIFCTRAAADAMKTVGGTVVNMTSGAQCGLSNQVVYSTTKGAVASLTYSLAIELKDLRIRVNAVSPLAATRMALFSPEFEATAAARDRELAPPENNAAVVAYLLSDCSSPLTGQVVRVNGDGISLMSHPTIMSDTFRESTRFSFEEVSSLFETGLSAAAVPLGIVRT